MIIINNKIFVNEALIINPIIEKNHKTNSTVAIIRKMPGSKLIRKRIIIR